MTNPSLPIVSESEVRTFVQSSTEEEIVGALLGMVEMLQEYADALDRIGDIYNGVGA